MSEKILQCGYMFGDTYSAAALLAADRTVKIILLVDTKARGQYADKSKLIEKIYAESGVSGQVIKLDISKEKADITAIWKTVSANSPKNPLPPPTRRNSHPDDYATLEKLHGLYAPKGSWPRAIMAVTGLLANVWKANREDTQKTVATAWKIGNLPTEKKFALYEYMGSKFAKTRFKIGDNIVVLWSRQSGKRGGVHLELDSSFHGIRQLAYHFAEESKRATVLLAGDEKSGKMASFAAHYPHIIDVTQMWEAPVWKSQFGEATFLAQFAFFKYLAEDYRVIHVGMRSGMLESMALLGMETFYLEDKGSGSGNRMIGFSHAGITYRRIQIDEAPGLTGKISQQKRLYLHEHVEDAIDNVASKHMNRRGFTRNFGRSGDDANWAARGYAKANLLGYQVKDENYDTGDQWDKMTMDLQSLRGFRDKDFDEITRLVEGKFVR